MLQLVCNLFEQSCACLIAAGLQHKQLRRHAAETFCRMTLLRCLAMKEPRGHGADSDWLLLSQHLRVMTRWDSS